VPTGSQHFNRDHVHLAMSALSRRIAFAQDLRRIVEVRRRNFLFLLERLRDLVPPLFTALPPGACPLFYPLVVPDRAELFARLNARGVEAIEFWRDGHPACALGPYPEVAALRRTVLEIPCHQDLSLDRLAAVADVVESALAGGRRTAAVSPGVALSPAPPP
jgi:dTDP-4-amino-4,6-dideoxygalactose transaminase